AVTSPELLRENNHPKKILKRAIAHFETSDENKIFSNLDLTYVKSHSLVVQFSKINVFFTSSLLVSSDLYNISQRLCIWQVLF
ncbi:hypothetical protein, partial [Paenibacillus graminis]|uniref:hypothetical protein n=1 Tax=Paenibacillus graminis TaxID=189425 RepID=UPI002DB7622D